MDMLEMMMRRRSIRKYRATRVEREKLEKIQEAGLYAPNPGGRQGSKIIMLDDAALIDRIGDDQRGLRKPQLGSGRFHRPALDYR